MDFCCAFSGCFYHFKNNLFHKLFWLCFPENPIFFIKSNVAFKQTLSKRTINIFCIIILLRRRYNVYQRNIFSNPSCCFAHRSLVSLVSWQGGGCVQGFFLWTNVLWIHEKTHTKFCGKEGCFPLGFGGTVILVFGMLCSLWYWKMILLCRVGLSTDMNPFYK